MTKNTFVKCRLEIYPIDIDKKLEEQETPDLFTCNISLPGFINVKEFTDDYKESFKKLLEYFMNELFYTIVTEWEGNVAMENLIQSLDRNKLFNIIMQIKDAEEIGNLNFEKMKTLFNNLDNESFAKRMYQIKCVMDQIESSNFKLNIRGDL